MKEYINIHECDKNLLLNKKENDNLNEKEGKLIENNKNIEKIEELDNIEKNKIRFGSYNSNNIYINNNIKENDNNINENYIYNNNINNDINENNYFNNNDFKLFLINNERNKDADTRNNKKLMDFEYYNNIL